MILIVYCTSSVKYVTKFYSPIQEYINGEGLCTTDIQNYADLEKISSSKYAESVYSYNVLSGSIANLQSDTEKMGYINSYDSKFIRDYKPILEKGKWLSECAPQDGVVNAVVTYTTEYNVGDVVTVEFDPDSDNTRKISYKIVGILTDGAKFLNAYIALSDVTDASSLYPNYYGKEHKDEMTFLTEKQQGEDVKGYPAMCLIKYSSGHTEEEYTKFTNRLAEEYDVRGVSVLILASILSMSAISSNRQLKNYGIYNICGGSKGGCVFVQVVNVLCSCVISSLLAYVIFTVMKTTGKLNDTVVDLGTSELSVCAALIASVMIVSAIMPMLVIGKMKLRDILTEAEV